MMENQPIVRLSFTCNRNWEDMTAVKNGRFCSDCQKKVVDFTDKTPDEIAAYLISNNTNVCGKFQQSQLAPSLPKSVWKRWLSAAAMFAAVFIGIKEASAQQLAQAKESNNVKISDAKPDDSVIGFAAVSKNPTFLGGEQAFLNYIGKNLKTPSGIFHTGTIEAKFIIERDGTLTNPQILKGLNKAVDDDVIKVLKESPHWTPGIQNGKAVKVVYTIPIKIKYKP